MPKEHRLDGFFAAHTETNLRRLLGREGFEDVARSLASSVEVARLVLDPSGETAALLRRREAAAAKTLRAIERLRRSLLPIDADMQEHGTEGDTTRIEVLRDALRRFEDYLRFETFGVPVRRRGPKPDQFRHVMVAFVADSLHRRGFPVSKKRGALLDKVLRTVWSDATGGTRPPVDLWHFIGPAIDQVRRAEGKRTPGRNASAGGEKPSKSGRNSPPDTAPRRS